MQPPEKRAHSNRRPRSETTTRQTLSEALIKRTGPAFSTLQVLPNEVTNVVSQRPSVSKLARFLLERGDSATSQLHVLMKFPDPLSRRLVQLRMGRAIEKC